ncbi:MAG: 4Fe-4S dicluster-binding protein [Anaerolineae bacterium]
MTQSLTVSRDVLLIGNGSDARRVASHLSELGYALHWVTPDDGQPAATLVGLAGCVGAFTGAIASDDGLATLQAGVVVVATGNERYFPAERYGVSLGTHVFSTLQIQAQLDAPRSTGAALPHRNERVFILLDYQGETGKEMSAECLRLAIRLREEWHCEVCVFYQNLKVDSYGLERLTRRMRDMGVVFCRYADPALLVDDDGVSLSYVEGTQRGDLLVLPEAVRPRADTAPLAEALRVRVGADGYFQDLNIHQYRPGLSVRRGVFFAGRCHLDGDESDVAADAAQAAANVDALLGSGVVEPEPIIAHVDSTQCVRCLTCVRTCPHAAIEIVDSDTAVAAQVVDLACRGCGACVANCPVQAIALVGDTPPDWLLARRL